MAKLTRRGALALLAVTVRAMGGGKAEAQEAGSTMRIEPATISIDLRMFKEWRIVHKGQALTIAADDLWTALGGKP